MGKQVMLVLSVLMSVMVLMAMSLPAAPKKSDTTCEEGMKKLMPCQPFLKGSAPPTPSASCCLGATQVFKQANTTEIRKSLCECFKKSAKQLGVLPERVKLIPHLCHISPSFVITPNMDCSKITV